MLRTFQLKKMQTAFPALISVDVLRKVIDTATCGLALLDKEQRFVWYNARFKKLLNLKTDILNLSVQDFFRNREKYFKYIVDSKPQISQLDGFFLNKGSKFKARLKIFSPKPKFVEISLFPLKSGVNTVGTLIKCEDLTNNLELKSIKRQIAENPSLFEDLFKGVKDYIFIKDLKGAYLAVNSAMAKGLGLPKKDIINKSDKQLLPQKTARKLRAADLAVIKSGKPKEFEFSIPTKVEEKIFHTRIEPFTDQNGDMIGVLGVSRDITEIKRNDERNRFLTEAAKTLHSSLDFNKILKTIADLAVAYIADWAIVDLVDDDQIRRIIISARGRKKLSIIQEAKKSYPFSLQPSETVKQVIKSGKSKLIARISDQFIAKFANDQKIFEFIKKASPYSAMLVPLCARNNVLGVLTLVSSNSKRIYNVYDLASVEELAASAGQAIENSKIHTEIKIYSNNLKVIFKGVAEAILVCDNKGRIAYINDAAVRLMDFRSASSVLSKPLSDVLSGFEMFDQEGHTFAPEKLFSGDHFKSKKTSEAVFCIRLKEKAIDKWLAIHSSHLFNSKKEFMFTINILRDITDVIGAEDKLRTKAFHQEAIAEFGRYVLKSRELEKLLEKASQIIARTLAVEIIRIFQLKIEGGELVLSGGLGWSMDSLNRFKIVADNKSMTGLALLSSRPIVVEDRDKERGFQINDLSSQHRIKSAISVAIKGRGIKPFGVMEACDTKIRNFTRDDINCISVIANMLAEAIQRRELETALKQTKRELRYFIMRRTLQLKKSNKSLKEEIVQRRRIEKILEEEKSKLEAIYKTTEEGLAMYDCNGRVLVINPALKKLFGVKGNIIGVTRREIVNNRLKYFKYDLERSDDSLKTQQLVLKGQTVRDIVIKVKSKPVRWLKATYSPLKDKAGTVLGIIATFVDITTLKNQEEAISKQLSETRRQIERWEAVFSNVEEAIFITNREGIVLRVNDSFETLTGFSQDEILNKPYYEVLKCHDKHGNFYPDFAPLVKVVAAGEPVPYDEHLHFDKAGNERWIAASYSPIYDDLGKIDQIVVINRDITSFKELERAKNEFVSLASHELRTPLTVINGYLSMLLKGDLGDFEQSEGREIFMKVLEKVYLESRRLTRLVEELLNVSRIEEGRIKLRLRKIYLSSVIKEVIGEFSPLAKEKDIKLDLKTNGDNLMILADQDKFKQILVNLLDNAVKYTPKGGMVVVSAYKEDNRVFVRVEDTGTGIPPQVLPRIFEKFQQGNGSYLKENKGAGLGLFIVKSLLNLHNGDIKVESTPGKGTSFIFNLPLVASE